MLSCASVRPSLLLSVTLVTDLVIARRGAKMSGVVGEEVVEPVWLLVAVAVLTNGALASTSPWVRVWWAATESLAPGAKRSEEVVEGTRGGSGRVTMVNVTTPGLVDTTLSWMMTTAS